MGTSIPFSSGTIDPYEAETTNPVNQIVFIMLFLLALRVIVAKFQDVWFFIKKSYLLFIFILFTLMSFFWSDYPFLSFKRSFQIVVTFITILNVITLLKLNKILKILLLIGLFYSVVNYISCIIIPEAIDPAFGTWRGIEPSKNGLGYNALMLLIIGYSNVLTEEIMQKVFGRLLVVLATGLIILAFSTTNIIGMILVLCIILLSKIKYFFKDLGISKFIFNLSLGAILVFTILLSVYSKEIISTIPGLFGKDTSLTGRDVIWIYIWNEILKRPLLGYGYGTYWIMGTHIIDLFSSYVGWRVNEAHNGFLEIALQLGIVGFAIFILTYFSFIIKALKQENILAIIVILAITLVNFSESFIFTPRDPSTLLFILFYLNLVKQDLNLNTNVFS